MEIINKSKLFNNELYTVILNPVEEYSKPLIMNTTNQCNLVGLKIWDSSYILNEYILSNKNVFENKTILELGSGVGINGLLIGLYIKCKQIIMSDYEDDIINNINDNIIRSIFFKFV